MELRFRLNAQLNYPKICHVLKTGENAVEISNEVRLNSLKPLDKMLELAK